MPRSRGQRVATTTALLAALLVLSGSAAPPAHATTITVDTAVDIPMDAPNHFPNNDGFCSLRAAIMSAEANSNAVDPECSPGVAGNLDIIQIDPALTGQTFTLTYNPGGGVLPFVPITATGGDLRITGPTTNPADFVISGGNAVRPFALGVFDASSGGDLTIDNLTVTGGNGNDNGHNPFTTDGDGGAFFMAAGSTLTFNEVVIRDNTVQFASVRGGAIYAEAPTTITNNGGAYLNNRALGDGGTGDGGGRGGAVFVNNGPWTMNGFAVLLQGNQASHAGGAIAANPGTGAPLVHLERSLLRLNTASIGGVFYSQPTTNFDEDVFELHDSTALQNSSIFESSTNGQSFEFLRNTFSDTGLLWSTGIGFVANSIIRGTNTCADTGGPGDITGSRNLIDPGGNCDAFAALDDIGNVTGLSASLAQNGGPKVQQTFALAAGSNAIDNGDVAHCGTIDARSVNRGINGAGAVNAPQPGDCDLGSYEYAQYIVNMADVVSTVQEADPDGQGSFGVKLSIPDPALRPTSSALTVPLTLDPTSTATIGPDTEFDDINITGLQVTFPPGSTDGTVVQVPVQIHQDDVAEREGELAIIHLNPQGASPGLSLAEPITHELTVQDDDEPGVFVDQSPGGPGTTIEEALPNAGESINVSLQSRPDREQTDPNDPQSYGDPADVTMLVEPDRDCRLQAGSSTTFQQGAPTGTPGNPLSVPILNADWQDPHPFTAFPVNDLYDEDFRVETAAHFCRLSFTFESLDPVYANTTDEHDVTVADNDVAGVNLVATGPSAVLAEGSSDVAGYQLSLDTPPDPGKPVPPSPRAATVVSVAPTVGCDVGNGPGVARGFMFTEANFAVPQLVEVRPSQNLIVELLHGCTVSTTVQSGDPILQDLSAGPPFSGTPPSVNETVQDYEPPAITDDPPFVNVTTAGPVEVGEATPAVGEAISVVLERSPVAGQSVTVGFAPNADDARIPSNQLAVSTPSLVFDSANWNVPQQVTVLAVDDDYDELDSHLGTITVSVSSTAPGFNSMILREVVINGVRSTDTGTLAAAISDDDTSEVLLDHTASTTVVTEGGPPDTATVSLATHPYDDVTVTVTAGPDCSVNGLASFPLLIEAGHWDVLHNIEIGAIDDSVVEEPVEDCLLTAEAASPDVLYDPLSDTLTAAVNDNDQPLVAVTTGDGVAVAEGGVGDTVSVVLGGEPSADVTVTFSGAGQATAGSLTFTPANWDQAQTANVSAVDDDIDETSPHPAVLTVGVTTAAPGWGAPQFTVDGTIDSTVDVVVSDDDTAGVAVSPTSLTVAEGGATSTYSVVLLSEPVADVTITPSAAGLCSVSGAFTFTPAGWDVPHAFTVSPGDDDIDHAQSCTITHTVTTDDPLYGAVSVDSVAVTVTDDDTAGITVGDASGLALAEADPGTTQSFTVVLTSEPESDVTVTPSAPDGQTAVGAALVFTPDNWDMPQTVTVTVVDDAVVEASPHAGAVGLVATSDDATYAAVSIAGVDVGITDDDTTTTVTVPGGADDATPTEITIAVAGGVGTPTGDVSVTLDGGNPVVVTLVDGAATVDLGVLSNGTHTVVATYLGDATHETSVGQATIDVAGRPVADDDAITVAEDSGATTVDVLDGDTDPDTPAADLEVTDSTDAANGTVACEAAECTYTPDPDFHGSDSFTYTVSDGARTDVGTVAVTITPVDDPPVQTQAIVVTTAADQPVTFDLLAGAVDPDGEPVELASFTQPAHGTLTCTPAGICTYTPAAGFSGTDSFTYVLGNPGDAAAAGSVQPAEASDTKTALIEVLARSQPPSTPAPPAGTGGSGPGGTGGSAIPRTGDDSVGLVPSGIALILIGFVLVGQYRVRRRLS